MRRTGDYHLAGDILQESFTRYLERYGDREQSVSLLYTIGRNLVYDAARARKGKTSTTENLIAAEGDHERNFLVREEYRQVMAAMMRLDDNERDILALAAVGDLSYREIARINGISETNVKVRVHRARIKLRKIMQAVK
jgi:RNA polymerase sigma-70 factor (ECF subfamily)